MCGAHPQDSAPEGVTRHIQTIGEVEPCKLAIKAIAPIRKFSALKEFIQRVDEFVTELKPKVKKLNGIYERSDVMFSLFPGNGSRFANHIDNTTSDGRMLTVVAYLNPNWNPENGGQLRVQLPQKYKETCTLDLTKDSDQSVEYVDVFPECGRVILFYSSEVRHEVMPAYKDRHACTIWYYDTEERKEAVKKAIDGGKSSLAAIASIEAQTEARTFIADLMGKDEKIENSNELMDATIISTELLNELNNKVQNQLSKEALGIVASITGAANADTFKEGFNLLTPEDLKSIRILFRRMGLNNEK